MLALTHRQEILAQISMSFARFGIEHSIVASGSVVRSIKIQHFREFGRSFVSARIAKVVLASVQTIARRLDKLKINPALIVVDEAHRAAEGTQFGAVLDHYDDARTLFVSATPQRTDGRGLGRGHGGYADALVMGPSMRWLIENNYLSDYKAYAPPSALDLSGVRTRMGDYAKDDLEKAVDKPAIHGSALQHYRALADGKSAIVFCVSVAHAEHVAEQFRAAGYKAASVDGSLEGAERDDRLAKFANKEITVLTSCELCNEGLDIVGIEVAILLRPTKSVIIHLQQIGRALRKADGKDHCIILDHVGNLARLGLPDGEWEWSLEGRQKRKKKSTQDEEEIKVKTCPKCFSVFAPAPKCPVCGHTIETQARKIEETDGKLIEITDEQKALMRRQRKMEERSAKTLDELIALGRSRKYQYPEAWARKMVAIRSARRQRQPVEF